jgi:Papain-like cysteine protease AvrRpt2
MKKPGREHLSSVADPHCVPIPLPASANAKWHGFEFPTQEQEQKNWCWAAVAASVADYYDSPNKVKQCDIANGELGRDDCCCKAGAEGPCDVYGFLMSSLYRVRHFEKWAVRKCATDHQIREEVDGCRPLCARIAWSGGATHFVTIVGYADKLNAAAADKCSIAALAIADTVWGLTDIDWEDFPENYMNGATWTDTYYTKPREQK